MSFVDDFRERESAFLKDAPDDFGHFAQEHPDRAAALATCQQSDDLLATRTETEEELRYAAAVARAEQKEKVGPKGGRPARTQAERDLDEFRAAAQRAADDAQVATDRWISNKLPQMQAEWEQLAKVLHKSGMQVGYCRSAVKYLEQAAQSWARAASMAQQVRQELAGLEYLSLPYAPYARVEPHELAGFIQSISGRVDREAARLEAEGIHAEGGETDQDKLARFNRDRRNYTNEIQKAGATYRKTNAGQSAWRDYRAVLSEGERVQETEAESDQKAARLATLRKAAGVLLRDFFDKAADHAGLPRIPDSYPKLST